MKKKLIIGIIISLVLLLVVYIILIINGIFPNPFLDTSDLTCSRRVDGTNEEEVDIFKFNSFAIVEKYIDIDKFYFDSIDETKLYHEFLESMKIDNEINEEENCVEIKEEIKLTQKNQYFNKTRKEIKNIFLNELYYSECK